MIRNMLMGATLALLTAPAFAAGPAETITTTDGPDYGTYLSDAEGRSVYLFESDRQGRSDQTASSSCGGDCAVEWPPVLTDGAPLADGAVAGDKLGQIDRGDGTMQVTYNGWPLYYYDKDLDPGQTNGQAVSSFHGGWFLLNPDGRKVAKAG